MCRNESHPFRTSNRKETAKLVEREVPGCADVNEEIVREITGISEQFTKKM
jgi:hypothetical protein